MLSRFRQTDLLYIILLSLSVVITSCGGGGSSSPTVQSDSIETGNVAVLLTDGPTDHYSAVNVTLTGIELLSDGGKVQIFSGEKTIDLLKLEDESTLFSLATDVPAVEYNKIRLHVSHVELVPLDPEEDIIIPQMGGNGKLDLNPRSSFQVKPGETLIMQIDLDAGKSIHIHETGSGDVQFRPVVFIDIIDGIFSGKLVRLEGFVKEIDAENKTFQLCPHEEGALAHLSSRDNDSDDRRVDRCVQIYVTENTSIFDLLGNQTELDALNVDDYASVLGHFRNGDHDMDHHAMGFDADIIEIGGNGAFIKLSGVIMSAPDESGTFSFHIDPGQGVIDSNTLTVQLQQGTRIYSQKGIELDDTDLEAGLHAAIDGILFISDSETDLLKAALIMVDTMEEPEKSLLEGTVSNIGDRTFDLTLADNQTVCVEAPEDTLIFLTTVLPERDSDDWKVILSGEGKILTLNTDSTGIETEGQGNVPFGTLENGDRVNVLGYDDATNCIAAETIWIEEICDDCVVID